MPVIELKQLSFSYQHKEVLADIDLAIEEGSVVALLGPNGSGKTTLLKLMLGLLKPDSGNVFINGRNISKMEHQELARSLAYVPQMHRESFAYLVSDVVLMGRMPHKDFISKYSLSDRVIVSESLHKLGIGHLADRPYTEISGGERQLTLIARAMAQGARIFIMDEPSNGLDFGNQIRLLERLKSLSFEGYTFVFSTHHPDHAMTVADRVVMMQQGRIIRDGDILTAVTTKSLETLYNVDVRLYSVEEGVQVCVPAIRLGTSSKELFQEPI